MESPSCSENRRLIKMRVKGELNVGMKQDPTTRVGRSDPTLNLGQKSKKRQIRGFKEHSGYTNTANPTRTSNQTQQKINPTETSYNQLENHPGG